MSVWKRCKNLFYFGPRLIIVGLFMLLVLAMALSNFDVLEPFLFPLHLAKAPIVAYGSNVTAGHFPQRYELEKLKKNRGVDLDVSLLDTTLPQEKALNDQVAGAARKLGIEFKSVPLGYMSLDSAENKRKIADLAAYLKANASRKVYIHCYLGRHRVMEVHDALAKNGVITAQGVPQ